MDGPRPLVISLIREDVLGIVIHACPH
ncbi:hypothetical protein CUJ84_pRLN2000094 (plasmid) [Rhizobium leguminosarum]|uniref:Uncharacterized protein n=1 Tax=Rhizobium leguminosarum TaxID=384 RepID=A0A2K9ZF33_RHILE|nr:hypothetical protein CUJ84_pRLN2000094 [Rhizobium leguminosarum]